MQLTAAAIGAAIGGGAAAFDNAIHEGQDAFEQGTSGDNRYTRAADVPTGAALGAAGEVAAYGSSAAVAAGAAGLAGVALYAFPIAVGVFALTELARQIEDLARSEEDLKRQKEVNRLLGLKQYRAAFERANQDAIDGYGGHGFRLERGTTLFPDDAELGDAPTVLTADGRVISVKAYLAENYAGAVAAAYRDDASIKNEADDTAWGLRHWRELEAGDEAARQVLLAQPWWMPGSFEWRPNFAWRRAQRAAEGHRETQAVLASRNVVSQGVLAAAAQQSEAGEGARGSSEAGSSSSGRWGELHGTGAISHGPGDL